MLQPGATGIERELNIGISVEFIHVRGTPINLQKITRPIFLKFYCSGFFFLTNFSANSHARNTKVESASSTGSLIEGEDRELGNERKARPGTLEKEREG